MTALLIVYVIIGAAVFGWLLADRTRDGRDGPPLYVVLLLPLTWLPAVLVVLFVVGAFLAVTWDRRFY